MTMMPIQARAMLDAMSAVRIPSMVVGSTIVRRERAQFVLGRAVGGSEWLLDGSALRFLGRPEENVRCRKGERRPPAAAWAACSLFVLRLDTFVPICW